MANGASLQDHLTHDTPRLYRQVDMLISMLKSAKQCVVCKLHGSQHTGTQMRKHPRNPLTRANPQTRALASVDQQALVIVSAVAAFTHMCVADLLRVNPPSDASKAKGSVAGRVNRNMNRKCARPTKAHRVIVALERRKMVHQWVQQNHDGYNTTVATLHTSCSYSPTPLTAWHRRLAFQCQSW